MKKNSMNGICLHWYVLRKALFAMKLTALIFLITSLSLMAGESYSQETRISLNMKNVQIKDVLLKIENSSEFFFIYNNQLIDVDRNVSINVNNEKITDVLHDVFQDQQVEFQLTDRKIVIVPVSSSGQQSQIKVSGKVTDSTGASLPGVSVVVKGTTTGVITDLDGKYTLLKVPENATLQFSFVGMKSKEVKVGTQSSINVILEEESIGLDEVVAIGYGTQSKRFVTGSISSVDMSVEGKGLPNTNVAQSLSSIPGIQFKSDGRPGQDGSLLIRGQNSLSGDNSPLIVLDGIIFSGTLSDINPQDIETIDVLKDASSATVYGSRAANGVMLIRSKKGTTEKPSFRVNLFNGVSTPGHELKLLTPERYIQRKLDWRTQQGLDADPTKIASYLSASEAENYKNGITNNPWDVISQDASVRNVDVSVSARTKYINYYLSGSFSNEKGLIFNDNQSRNTFRANVSSQLNDWINVGMDATFSHRDLSGISASVFDAYRSSPYSTYYYADGEPTQYSVAEEQAGGNPLRNALLTKNKEIYENLFSNFFADIDIPFIKGLSYKMNYSPNVKWGNNYNYVRQDQHVTYNMTSASKYNQREFTWVWENILTYKKDINKDHSFDVTFLFGRNHNDFESTTASASLLNVDGLGYDNLGLGSTLTNISNAYETEGISYMGRLNYRFKNRYLFTLTSRRDGSSVFAKNNKYATFPSGSVAWILSEESFMKNLTFLNVLKLRYSYGSVGNQAISPYQSLSLSDTKKYVFGDGGATSIGIVTSTLGNENLKWETTTSSDFAIDYDLFKHRISGTIELYNSTTKDLLVRRAIPVMSGYTSILSNIGETSNKGIELTINTVNIKTPNLKWSSNFSIAYNKNEIVHLYGQDLDGDGVEDSDISNKWFIGKPINSYYDYVFDGIYQVGDKDIPAGSQAGFVRVKDISGDGIINSKDRKVVGSGESPKYQISLRNNIEYKNFTLSVSLYSMLGWSAPFNLINPLVPGRSLGSIDVGWWTAENKSNTRPSLNYSNPLGTSWYMSRDFFRVKEVSLAYDFNKAFLDKVKLSGLSVYLSAKNLYTLTNWLGSDPENGGGYDSEQGSDLLYPMPRTFSIGMNVSF